MISKFNILNFRNISNLSVSLTDVNIVVAPNAKGKTNLLEAIFFAFTSKTLKKIQTLNDLIGPISNTCKVTINLDDNSVLEYIITKINHGNKTISKKSIKLNNKNISHEYVAKTYPVISFVPSSINSIEGEPNERREEIDSFLSILYYEYGVKLDEYKKILKHRNEVLEKLQIQNNNTFLYQTKQILDEKISTLASIITLHRIKLVQDLSPIFLKLLQDYNIFGDNIEVQIKYISNVLNKSNHNIEFSKHFLKNLNENELNSCIIKTYQQTEKQEIVLGHTIYGPHRDDFEFTIKDKTFKYFASRGQQRILLFLLKISMINLYYNIYKKYPFVLLDDIMSEIDTNNRMKIIEIIGKQEFKFILTSLTEDDAISTLVQKRKASLIRL
ncbi:MAG: DNA replication and repair protein RecF [Candidatus Dojkabacteria bacterium]|nr:DNA replication and repair protein RecF [Candidatus Dojkabacteria bacterium]